MRFYGSVARLQAPSCAVARAIAAEAPQLKKKIAIIPYPAPPSVDRREPPPIGAREKIILFVGRVHPEKGVHLLIEAFANMPFEIVSNWTLSIVGPTGEEYGGGGQQYLAQLKHAAEKGAGRAFFNDPIFDPDALEQNFRAARLFVYPSLAERGESFGLAPLEAMAHGCAALVSSLDCFGDFVRDGETGFAFDHRAASPSEALRDKIEKIIRDESLLSWVAEAGYRESAKYSLPRVADQFLHDFSLVRGQADAAGTNR
jgi:glycosyltransferase involved in cell wall biosynthesis